MGKKQFVETLHKELARIGHAKTSKRFENVIEGFTKEPSPQSADCRQTLPRLQLQRLSRIALPSPAQSRRARRFRSVRHGSGSRPLYFRHAQGASGSRAGNRRLSWDGRTPLSFRAALQPISPCFFASSKARRPILSSSGNTMVVSDALNHRSIIDGVRVANLPKEQRFIFKHLDANDLDRILTEQKGAFQRVVVVTDGIFSMLGEAQDIKKMRQVIDAHDAHFEEGILLVVDDAHGVGAFGKTGRGVEEVFHAKADLLIGTLGKAFGADGGYVAADQTVIDYLRESAATYIYSNSISPGTAGAALASLKLVQTSAGEKLFAKLVHNREHFQKEMQKAGGIFAAHSTHPIQPLLLGDATKTGFFKEGLFEGGILVTNINYPVVPKGRDEIRVQISAAHTEEDIGSFVDQWKAIAKKQK